MPVINSSMLSFALYALAWCHSACKASLSLRGGTFFPSCMLMNCGGKYFVVFTQSCCHSSVFLFKCVYVAYHLMSLCARLSDCFGNNCLKKILYNIKRDLFGNVYNPPIENVSTSCSSASERI